MASKLRQDWFCAGCRKLHHKYQRDIEGHNHAGYWCAHSIREGIKARRNDLPAYAGEHFPAAYRAA